MFLIWCLSSKYSPLGTSVSPSTTTLSESDELLSKNASMHEFAGNTPLTFWHNSVREVAEVSWVSMGLKRFLFLQSSGLDETIETAKKVKIIQYRG